MTLNKRKCIMAHLPC